MLLLQHRTNVRSLSGPGGARILVSGFSDRRYSISATDPFILLVGRIANPSGAQWTDWQSVLRNERPNEKGQVSGMTPGLCDMRECSGCHPSGPWACSCSLPIMAANRNGIAEQS